VTECKCDPPADKITMAMDQDSRCRVILRVGGDVGSIPAAMLEKAHQEVAGITGLPTGASYHDRKCECGLKRDYTEVVVFPERSAESADPVI
jgi:hypothetical protein